jgi:hypothetical protein
MMSMSTSQVIRLPKAKDTLKTDAAVKVTNKASDSPKVPRYPMTKPETVLDPDSGLYTAKGQVWSWYHAQRRMILSREIAYLRLSLDTESYLVSQSIEAEIADYYDRAVSEIYASMDIPTDIDAVRQDIERLKALGVSVDDSALDATKTPMTGRQAIDSIRIELYLAVDMILQRLRSISEVCNPIKR